MKTLSSDLKVTFYLKKNVSRNGLSPVMGRIRIGNDMAQFSCKLDADPALWDTRAGRVNGKSGHARTVNREIDRINVAVHARYKDLVSVKKKADAFEVKNAFQGIASIQETLLHIFREHNEEYHKRIGVNRTFRTWQNYDIARLHLERFIRHKYHVSDIPVKQLDYSFIEDYDFYLRIECRQMPNTILRQVSSLRKMAKMAIGKGIISRDPFTGYKPERPKTQQKYLPKEELEKLINTTFDHPNRNFVRDMFIFSCFTGLALTAKLL